MGTSEDDSEEEDADESEEEGEVDDSSDTALTNGGTHDMNSDLIVRGTTWDAGGTHCYD